MRFPFEFLHLNEARGIRSRRRRLIYIYIYIQPCFEFVRANYRSPSSRPCYSPPLGVDRFPPLFNPGDRLARWFIYFLVFRPPSTSLLLSVHRRLLVPILRPFRSISSSFCSRRLRRCRVDDDVEFSSRLWRRPGAADFRQLAPARGPRVQYSKLSLFLFHGNNFFFSSLPLPSPVFAIVSLFYSLYAFSFPFFPLSDQATLWNNSLSLRLEIVKGR